MEKDKVICDTDVMIDYLDRRHARHLPVRQIIENTIGLNFVTLSAITKMELMMGAPNKADLIRLTKNIGWFNILLINPEITLISLQLIEKYRLSHNVAIADSLIAATAIHSGLKLFTFNVSDFKFIPGLELYQIPDQE